MERVVYKGADKVVVISGPLGEYMKQIGVKEADILLLPPAVDVNRFNPMIPGDRFREEIGVGRNDKVALFSGWLYEFSGLDSIMKSIDEILADVPEFKLVVCGEGPLLQRLQSMRERLDLQDSVKIIPRRPFNQMPEIVASADVCINPYFPEIRSNFAFPSKIAEYMAAGKAVIATDLPGTRSFLGDGSGVVLVSTQDFPSALKKVMLDNETRSELGRASRKYCEERFSLSSITDRFESLLSDLARN
jgi:glycosyltransferase involved in cell wall biosynthesis